MRWASRAIGEICEVVSGATPKSGNQAFWDGDVPWVTPKDLSDLEGKILSDPPRKITDAGFKSCSTRMLPKQSVLFSSRAPIGLVALNSIPVCTNQGFKSLVPKMDLVSPDFLYWWLKLNRASIERLGRGATFKEVSKKIVEEIQVPLPPLPEQKHIAAILDKADELRAKRREAIAELDNLVQATFLDMFGDPVTNPMGWPMMTLGDVASVGSGSTPSRNVAEYFEGDVPWVKSTEVSYGEITSTSESISSEAMAASRLKLYPKGSVIIAMYGQGKTRGQCATLGIDATVNQACCALIPNENCRSEFIFYYLKYSYERLRSEGRGGNQENLNAQIVRGFAIPVPPLTEQDAFVSFKRSADAEERLMRSHSIALDELFASLQHRAFNGDL